MVMVDDSGFPLAEGELRALSLVLGDMLERQRLRNDGFRALMRYYEGDPPMPWVHSKARERYRDLIKQSRSNFPLLVVDSVGDRLKVEGFRLDEQVADNLVWDKIWQANAMDVFAPVVHRMSLITGTGYVSVWSDSDGQPRVRGESPFEVFHDPDPDDPLRTARALKVWRNTLDGRSYARLMFPDSIVSLSAPLDPHSSPDEPPPASWRLDGVAPNPLGLVPVVPFLNRPNLDGTGTSEIVDLLDIFDRINTLTAQLMLAAELGAFRIRWATGLEIPRDQDGRPVEPFDVALNRLWINESPDGKFGSFDGTPLEPYQSALDQAIQQVAAISRTPPFLLLGKLTNLSAEALKATESGLVQKVRNRQMTLSESWLAVVRLGLRVLDDPRADLTTSEVIWHDPENVSEAARVDALMKLSSMGLPWRAVMERWGATPGEVQRWEAMRADDVFQRLMLAGADKAPGLSVSQPQPPPEGVAE